MMITQPALSKQIAELEDRLGLPINQAMNRPRAKLWPDLSTWMAIVFVNITVFLDWFRLVAMLSFPMMAVGAWLISANTQDVSALGP